MIFALAGRQVGQIATKGKRHFPEQVVRKLSQADPTVADGSDIAVVCRELGLSDQSCYRRWNYYGAWALRGPISSNTSWSTTAP